MFADSFESSVILSATLECFCITSPVGVILVNLFNPGLSASLLASGAKKLRSSILLLFLAPLELFLE